MAERSLTVPVIVLTVVLGILFVPHVVFKRSQPPQARLSRRSGGLRLSPSLAFGLFCAVLALTWVSSISGDTRQGASDVANNAKESFLVLLLIIFVVGALYLKLALNLKSHSVAANKRHMSSTRLMMMLVVVFVVMTMMYLSNNSYNGSRRQSASTQPDLFPVFAILFVLVFFIYMKMWASALNLQKSGLVAAAKRRSTSVISPMMMLVVVFVMLGMICLSSDSNSVRRGISSASQSDLVPVFVILFILIFFLYMKM